MFLKKSDEREYVLRLIQDLRVKMRDLEDFSERRRLAGIIKKLERGFREEFGA